MVEALYKTMGLPEACHLGKRVYKKLFHENADLGPTDKKAFRDDINTVTWLYTLKPHTIAIHAYKDDEREYDEIAILQVDLNTQKRINRIAEVVHRAIPYPIVVVFSLDKEVAISLAHKRFSRAEHGAIVADDFHTTDWIDLTCPTDMQQSFLQSVVITELPHTHLFAFYSALVERVIALRCARLSGAFRLEATKEQEGTRRERLAACHQIEVEIVDLKAAIKRETQFNRQVELNTQIKTLENQLAQVVERL